MGESIVVIGQALSVRQHVTAAAVAAFITAFAGSVALWWIYFDRSAQDAARIIAASADPGALANSAYHLIHPVMVAGIIVAASADQEVLTHPGAVGRVTTSCMVIGGAALFLPGTSCSSGSSGASSPGRGPRPSPSCSCCCRSHRTSRRWR